MLPTVAEWNPLQSRLKEIILNKEMFGEAVDLTHTMHSIVHSSSVYGGDKATFMDGIWSEMNEKAFREMPTVKDATAAWDIWHISRIEDIAAGILIADNSQVLNDEWLDKLNTEVKDTANAMTDEEIIAFSTQVSMDGLRAYRDAVGLKTKEILDRLKPEDMKRKMTKRQLDRIAEESGVLQKQDSVWLLDFWGRKNVAGLIMMPITRHQIVHLNDCCKLIARSKKS